MKIKSDFVTNSSSASFIIADMRKNKDEAIWVEDKMGTRFNILILEAESLTKMMQNADEMVNMLACDEIDYCKSLVLKERALLRYLVASDEENIISVGICRLGINDLKFPSKVKVIRGEGGY